jgi:outer membrane protein W
MKLVKGLILVGIVALVVPQIAAAADAKNEIGVVVGYIAPMSDSTFDGAKQEADSTVDYGIAYKYRFRENMSFGASVLYANHDLKADGEKAGTISNMPLLFDFNLHLLKGKQLYVGVTVGYAFWGDAKDVPIGDEGEPGTVTVKQNFVYGLNLGYDFHLGDKWAILTNVRYLGQKVEPDVSGASDLSVNPIVANVGLAYRF